MTTNAQTLKIANHTFKSFNESANLVLQLVQIQ